MKREVRFRKRFLTIMLVLLMVITNVQDFQARVRVIPAPPTNLKAINITQNSVTLSWSPSTSANIKAYVIYKNNVAIGTVVGNMYKVTNLSPGTSYQFSVKAQNIGYQLSVSSNVIMISTLQVTIQPSPVTSKIIGYYAAWAAYSGFTPDRIDAAKLTHINYAFANIGSDLKLTLGYPDVDLSNFAKLKALKQINPNLKTIISVGGWSWSGRFSDAALTDASRTVFADSVVQFLVNYRFDGVDIDWEYPVSGGLATNVRRPEDKQNFTLLMQKIREKLDARGAIDGKKYLLTFAGAASVSYVDNVELTKLSQYVDYVNLMTYDIHGPWDAYTDFNAPLYESSDNSPQYKWSVNTAVNYWINQGYPAQKIVMGVPFYGYVYQAVTNQNNGLYQRYSGGSSISYENIAKNYLNNPSFTSFYHPESMAPWLFNGTTFITLDNEQSLAKKAQYLKSKGLGGVMIWELSQDPNRVLLTALYNNMK